MSIDVPTLVVSALIGGGSGLTLFQTLGKGWIDNRFAQRLEASKQELQRQLEASRQDHATDIERLRFRVAGHLDRATKLNQREFEVLPELWAKLDDAYRATISVISAWRSYPDLQRMGDGQFKAYINGSRLQEWQKDEIKERSSIDRQRYLTDALSWIELHEAKVAVHNLGSQLTKNAIYLSPEVHARISTFSDALFTTVREYELDKQYPTGERRAKEADPIRQFGEKGQAQYDDLAAFIRNRFWEPPVV